MEQNIIYKEKVDKSWHDLFADLFMDSRMKSINEQLTLAPFLPTKNHILRVFEMPLQDIKVVIIGQDQYPTKAQATGIAFAVPTHIDKPRSLISIEKAIGKDVESTLNTWTQQGVFLINRALTVELGKPGSHLEFWKWFTNKVFKYISIHNPCIWLLWGNKVKEILEFIEGDVISKKNITLKSTEYNLNSKNTILTSPHPVAEFYSTNGAGFYDCDHFIRVNEILSKQKSKIVW
jgi:uracil-DNA glycosylase